jgi:beta-lactamase class A
MLKTKVIIPIFLLVSIAGVIGFFIGNSISNNEFHSVSEKKNTEDNTLEQRAGGSYKFINPLLECDNFQPSRLNSLIKIETELKNYITQSLTKGTSNHISFYFRSLNGGPWIGIDEHHNYSPASLLKVPIMIGVLKKAEKEPGLLSRKINYSYLRDKEYVPNIKDQLIKVGNAYKVQELIKSMIEHSDNEAKELLVEILGEQELIQVLEEIGVNTKGVNLSQDFVSVKAYSSFFRLLFNATYLNREMSELALNILNTSAFKKGIPAQLPTNMVVSHKFGERGFIDSDKKQLHDCGIVYLPNNPYLVCIMTKGDNFDELTQVIADISGIVYKNVNATNGNIPQ